MRSLWWYSDWDGKLLMIGGDEYFRRTLVIGVPFTTWAVVIPTSRPGALYDPQLPDRTFERWQRVFRRR